MVNYKEKLKEAKYPKGTTWTRASDLTTGPSPQHSNPIISGFPDGQSLLLVGRSNTTERQEDNSCLLRASSVQCAFFVPTDFVTVSQYY